FSTLGFSSSRTSRTPRVERTLRVRFGPKAVTRPAVRFLWRRVCPAIDGGRGWGRDCPHYRGTGGLGRIGLQNHIAAERSWLRPTHIASQPGRTHRPHSPGVTRVWTPDTSPSSHAGMVIIVVPPPASPL